MIRHTFYFFICLFLIGSRLMAQDSTKINWEEFYPLHPGDFWKYEEDIGWSTPLIFTKKVIDKDTMSNHQCYAKIVGHSHGLVSPSYEYQAKILADPHEFSSQSYEYQRVDTIGNVYGFNEFSMQENLLFKLNVCVGDTFRGIAGWWRVLDKYDIVAEEDTITTIKISLYNPWAYEVCYITEGLGITTIIFEGGSLHLIGACINGIVYWDTTTTDIPQRSAKFLPESIKLAQNYPNPFNQSTRIGYEIAKGGKVSIRIFNLKGELIKQITNEIQPKGRYEVNWDGRNENGEEVTSGIYLFQLETENLYFTKRLLLLK